MKIEEVENKLELLRKEWDELAPAVKYSIIFSAIAIFLLWIDKKLLNLDFFDSIFKNSFSFNANNLYFLIVNLLIILIFLILILERGYINLKMIYYRWKYPLNRLNKDFYIVSFQGRVCLIDINKKEIRWIKTWQTALDLDFIGEWTYVDEDITLPSKLNNVSFKTKDGIEINLRDYKYVCGIHTQKAPGT